MIGLILRVQEKLGLPSTGYGLVLAVGGGIAGRCERIMRRMGHGPKAQWMLFTSMPAFAVIAF
jgi:hypothetical protein